MAVYFPYKKKRFGLMGGYLGDRGAGPMGSGNIEIPHLPPPLQRTPEQEVSGLPPGRFNRYNRWVDIEKSPNLNKWGSMPSSPQYDHTMGAGAGSEKPTSMLKNPFGKMSPEELKDFQEVLKEMSLDMKPEFVGDLYRGEDKQYAYEPSIFSDATADEYKKRKQRYKYLA